MLLHKYYVKFKSTVIQKVTFFRLIMYHRQQKSVIVTFKGILRYHHFEAHCDNFESFTTKMDTVYLCGLHSVSLSLSGFFLFFFYILKKDTG